MSKPLNVRIIEGARALIEDERHWCRGTLAVDAGGNPVCATSRQAKRRCALGAVTAAAYDITNDPSEAYDLAISVVRSFRGASTLVNVNDVQGHAGVLAPLDEALRHLTKP